MLAGRLAARQAVKMGKSPQQAGQEVRQREGSIEMRRPCRKPMVFLETTSFLRWMDWMENGLTETTCFSM